MKSSRFFMLISVLTVIIFFAFLELALNSVILSNAVAHTEKANPAAQVESSVSELFPFASQLSQMRTLMELFTGRNNINSVYILNRGLIKQPASPNANLLLKNMKFISDKSYDGAKKYLMVVPCASDIYSSDLPNTGDSSSQKISLKNLYDSLSNASDVTTIDAESILNIVKDEYIYYRTDENLTSVGGYYLYKSIGKKMGFQVLDKQLFDIVYNENDFYGSLCGKTSYYGVKPDVVSYYIYNKAPELSAIEITAPRGKISGTGAELLQKSLFSVENIDEEYWSVNIDTELKSGQNLLVFTSGISKAIIPYLCMHYKHITVIGENCPSQLYEKIISQSSYDQILFAINMDQFMTEDLFANFK